MSKRNYRKRRQVEGDEDNDASEQKETVSGNLIEERKEIQKLRKRQKGVSATGLALGETCPRDNETGEADPFKTKIGGLWDMHAIKDRDRDREGEEKERSISLGSSFAVETNRRDEDTHMLMYIEEQMMKKKGEEDPVTPEPRVKSKEDALYELPEKLKVKSQLKQSEEMLSNQMLSGIPEVNLGIQAKIQNIEETEEAKRKVIEERRNKRNQGPSIMVPTNVAVDFVQHNRFFDERKNTEIEKKKLLKLAKEKEEIKPQGPAVTAESLGVGVDGEDGSQNGATSGYKKTGNVVDKASDDFIFEKFKNRTRDSWRYR